MSEKKDFNCPIEGCKSTFFTQTGLDFHVKNKHGEEPIPTPKTEKPAPKAKKSEKVEPKKEVKEKRLSVTEYEKQTKEKSANLWKKRLKAMRNSLATVKVGDKLTKAELVKLVGDSEGISMGDEPVKRFSDGLRKQKYTITKVMEKKNGWYIFYAESPTHRVIWKEGPIKGNHFVTVPMIVKK